jgi:hypothetical protein
MGERTPRYDLKDQTFGSLLVLGRAGSSRTGADWWCRCVAELEDGRTCNRELRVPGRALRVGQKPHCGCQAWTVERRAAQAERLSSVRRAVPWTPERREKARRSVLAHWTPLRRAQAAIAARNAQKSRATAHPPQEWTPERKAEAAQRAKSYWSDEKNREAAKARAKAFWTPGRRARAVERAQAYWTPERRAEAAARARKRAFERPPVSKIDLVEAGFKPPRTHLEVLAPFSQAHSGPRWRRQWICRCLACGLLCVKQADKLAYSSSKTCGCGRIKAGERSIELAQKRVEHARAAQALLEHEQELLAEKADL